MNENERVLAAIAALHTTIGDLRAEMRDRFADQSRSIDEMSNRVSDQSRTIDMIGVGVGHIESEVKIMKQDLLILRFDLAATNLSANARFARLEER